MSEWNIIKTSADIDILIKEYYGFHDTCLVETYYKTGEFVDKNNAMHVASRNKKELHMIFHSQWKDTPLELCFTGVKQCRFGGWTESYGPEILDCHLAIHKDLFLPRLNDPLIVWADEMCFSPKDDIEILREPPVSFVIATDLKWRFHK